MRRPRNRYSRYRRRYDDPEGRRYGIPTYQWGIAPEGLFTLRQLAAMGLRPGGQQPVAQVMWRRCRQDAIAYLYDIAKARPKRPMTPAKQAALAKANAARRICPTCIPPRDVGYVIPRREGQCGDCIYARQQRRDMAA